MQPQSQSAQSQSQSANVLAFDQQFAAKEVLTQWMEALKRRSADALTDLYSDQAVLIPTLAPDLQRSPLALHKYFTMLTAREALRVVLLQEDFRMLGKNAAIHAGIYRFEFQDETGEQSLPARFTFVYAREGTEWKILHHHSSQLPDAAAAST